MRSNAILNSYFFCLFARRYFVFSPHKNAKQKDEKMKKKKKRHAKRQNNEKTPREITKRRNACNARRKDEITKRRQAKINEFKMASFRARFSIFRAEHFVISSFRLAVFRLFVISCGVFSLFRLFAWRYFVFSVFRVASFRYFVISLGVISSFRRTITPGEKTRVRNIEMAQTGHHILLHIFLRISTLSTCM